MPQYMLVLRDDPTQYQNLTPAQWEGLLGKYNAWSERVASEGRLLDGKKLTDSGGKVLRMQGNKMSVKDGPFAETKEIVGGFYLLKADSYDHAVKLCHDHPAFATNGTVEIREVDFMGQPEE